MSDPTYRIEVNRSDDGVFRWTAVVRQANSDRSLVGVKVSVTRAGALRAARRLAKAHTRYADLPTEVLLVDDDGRPVEGHSVKA